MAVTVSHYRFGIDQLAESTHGWYANEDTNPQFGVIPLDTTFLLRFCLQADGSAANNQAPQFEYRVNGGTWTAITTTSNVARAVAAAAFANGDNTTKRLSGTGTFETSSAGCTEDGLAGGTAMDIVASGNAETECSMQLRSADLAVGDLVEFRVTGGAISVWSVTPALGIPLNASFTDNNEGMKTRDLFIAAAIGVASALLSAGLIENSVRMSESVQAQLVIPITGTESLSVVDGPLSAALISTDQAASSSEAIAIGTSGRVDLIGLGNPVRVIDGPPVAELVSGAENLSASPSEALKLDEGGFVERIGPGSLIRIADGPVVAQLVSGGLSAAVAEEILKLTDVVLPALTPEEASIGESLKVVDAILGPTLDPEQTALSESLKVVDTIQAALDIMQALLLTESLKVVDFASVTINPEQTSPSEDVKVADSVSIFINPEQTSPSEALRVVDAVSVTINPEETSPSESLKVVDTPNVTINPEQANPSESLRISDSVSAARIAAGTLAATLEENLKAADAAPSRTLNPEQATPSESLKVVDTLTVSRDLTASLTENLKVGYAGEVELSRDETVKISDVLTVTITPIFALPSETLKIVDSAAASTGPAASVSELVKVSDSVLASLSELSTSVGENVKIADSGQVELAEFESIRVIDTVVASIQGPANLSASISESLKVIDQFSVASQLAVQVVTEQLKVVDSALSVMQLGVQVANESLKVVDETFVGRLNPLQASPSEALKIVDVSPSITTGTTIAVIASEALQISDALVVALDPELAAISENIKIVDAIVATLDPEQTELAEGVRCSDVLQVALDPLETTLSEQLRLQDGPPRFGGPRVIDIVGTYSTTIDIVGTYDSTGIIDIVGTYGAD